VTEAGARERLARAVLGSAVGENLTWYLSVQYSNKYAKMPLVGWGIVKSCLLAPHALMPIVRENVMNS